MYLIVGLGNPGRKYEHTRHNVGFDVLEIISQKYSIPIQKLRCKAVVGEGSIHGHRVVLAQPQTFMNLSGESVVQLLNWYKPEEDHLIVVYDDVDLKEGKIRFRPSGSAGTHNGMRSIIGRLRTYDFPRVRIGIGKNPPYMQLANYVLMKLKGDAKKAFEESAEKAALAVEELIKNGAQSAMSRFNGK